ncbi:MATE family efflux transporter [Hoeflea prorocentri]|uniref:MATE family efflux transporter n=1 Tax=Hoeflea prorocentri TaxID=1922333 RepID=A0A9X3ULA4_9HYPH|nr:MATE family efflux transporter [Hoeflea prorocentri]MCY6382505.1 MATE family efflux transporter [Hoeflea prorocentri]MDA5400305.1 MATE family efflux transporter [Hoeflea prorocentri]
MTREPEQAGPAQRPFSVSHRLVLSIAVPMTLAYLTTPLLGLVDTAVVGQLGQPALIGGLAVGAIIFDLVFTTFNFLRAATTGLVAQAFGRGDGTEEQAVFWRSLIIGIVSGAMILLLSPLIIVFGLWAMAPGEDVRAATQLYVSVRMVSAPMGLANYAILGFVLGRGEAVAGLLLQTLINGINIVLSIYLGLMLEWGIAGVAWATVIGETVGALVGFTFVVARFDRSVRPSWRRVLDRPSISRLMSLNRDIMIRSFALLAAFALFVRQGAQFGPVTLAANAILMNFFLVAGYYLDGFATAAEQLAGRAIGANYRPAFDRAVRLTLLWGFALASVTTVFFLIFGGMVVDILTVSEDVRAESRLFIVWAALTAVVGVLAFQMDGVFIGATWSNDMRNMMLASLALFGFLVWLLVPMLGNHGLWIALLAFLGARGITLYLILGKRVERAF